MKTLKDFLNERQLGPMVVKNPDEQEYVDKHVVQKHDDRNGNGDDVFKAANVKKADRKKDRHGYEPGEDEEVYEEAEQIDELSQDKLMAYRSAAKKQGTGIQDKMKVGGGDWSKDGKDTKTLKKRLSGYKMAGRKVNPGLAATAGKAPRVAANEEAEQIDELSKETKASYMKKAGAEIDKHWDKSKTDARSAYKYYGRKNTMKKIANEEVEQIDELSKNTLSSYIKKSTRSVVDHSVDATNADRQGEYDTADANYKKISNRIKGVNKAADKLSEKIDMDKASMGDVIKDFQDSDAPQFKGKSDKKRRAMAIAAKLTAERGSKGYTKEERLLARLENVSEGHQDTLVNIFSKLSEENQNVFLKVCETESGIDQMLDFAIQNRGK